MATAIIRKRGTLVIPADIRERYGLDEGTAVTIDETGEGLVIRAAARPRPALKENKFWAEFEESIEKLASDPAAWAEYRAEFHSTEVFDGLEHEPPYPL